MGRQSCQLVTALHRKRLRIKLEKRRGGGPLRRRGLTPPCMYSLNGQFPPISDTNDQSVHLPPNDPPHTTHPYRYEWRRQSRTMTPSFVTCRCVPRPDTIVGNWATQRYPAGRRSIGSPPGAGEARRGRPGQVTGPRAVFRWT